MPRLEVRGLTRRPFFEGRDLALAPGEILVLYGPSGSGKTLFLRAVADLDAADDGEVFLEGVLRAEVPGPRWRARVLYVHQTGVRLPGTVRENLDRIAALGRRRGAGRPRIPSVPGLRDDQDALRLSGGEAQALALHRALALEPRVLLLDEATSAMDPDRARAWEERVRTWTDGGGAAVWIAHDEGLADRLHARRERFA